MDPTEATQEGPEKNTSQEQSTQEHTTQVRLTGYEAYMAESIEHIRNMQGLLLESNMRIYDALIVLITTANNHDRTIADGLRAQHAEGSYYFPPFSVADAPDDKNDDTDD